MPETQKLPPNKPLNRLRAAAALIPVVELGLFSGKMDLERATYMAEFCVRSIEKCAEDNEESRQLILKIKEGLDRLKIILP